MPDLGHRATLATKETPNIMHNTSSQVAPWLLN